MRVFPIDSNRVRMISTGTCTPVVAWVELADGSRRPDPNGRQDLEEHTGLPLWRCEVIVPSDDQDDRDKTAVVEVTIASKDKPDAGAFGDMLVFDGLAMSPGYVSKKTGALSAPRWSASGIRRQGQPQHKPQAA